MGWCSFQAQWSDCRLPFLFLHVKMQLMFFFCMDSLCGAKWGSRITAAARPHHLCQGVPTILLILWLCRWGFGDVRRMLDVSSLRRGEIAQQVPLGAAGLAANCTHCLWASRPAWAKSVSSLWRGSGWEICARPPSILLSRTASWVGIHVWNLSLTFPPCQSPWGLPANLPTRAVPADGILYADTTYSDMWVLERLSLTFLGIISELPKFNLIKFLWRHRKFQPVKHFRYKKPSAFIVHGRLLT